MNISESGSSCGPPCSRSLREKSKGKEQGGGGSQYVAFTGKGGGEEEGENDSHEALSKRVLAADLGCRVQNRIQHTLCWYII